MKAAYLICTTPRSGSWLLADGLDQTGLAGHPQEYFMNHVPFYPSWGLHTRDNISDYFTIVRGASATGNGVCGLKMHWSQLRYLARVVGGDINCTRPAFERIAREFDPLTVIRLERADKVRQALSYHRAMTDQRWWRLADEDPGDSSFAGPAFEEVARLVELLERHDYHWNKLVDEAADQVIHVGYEELAFDPTATVLDCLVALGIDRAGAKRAVAAVTPRLTKQSDERTDLWVHQFLSWRRQQRFQRPPRYEEHE